MTKGAGGVKGRWEVSRALDGQRDAGRSFLASSYPLRYREGTLRFLGHSSTNWAFSVLRWAPVTWHFSLFFIFLFLVRQIGPLPKDSGPNPMSFQFFGGGTLGPP